MGVPVCVISQGNYIVYLLLSLCNTADFKQKVMLQPLLYRFSSSLISSSPPLCQIFDPFSFSWLQLKCSLGRKSVDEAGLCSTANPLDPYRLLYMFLSIKAFLMT